MFISRSSDLSCYIGHRIKVELINWEENNQMPTC